MTQLLSNLTSRIKNLNRLNEKIEAIENSIIDETNIPTATLDKVELYERLVKVQISYVEAIRKVFSQIDVSNFLRYTALADLVETMENMSPEGIRKIKEMISE